VTPPPDPVIALEGFGFRHVGAARSALEGVTIDVRLGEYVAVLGATGAGVTTLLTAINGVVPQLVRGEAAGSIAVLGRDPRVIPVREWARHVGVVFDDPSLAATQATVADEVAFGLENLGVAPAEMDLRISRALSSVGLAGFEPRVPSTLSGGELQRLSIACALVTGPSILVLDEPSANLDPAGRRAVFAILRRLNREHGVTLLVADADVEALAAHATRVLVLHEGRVVADGSPDVVLGSPSVLARVGARSTDAANLAEALGMPSPVPTSADRVARGLARRERGTVHGATGSAHMPVPGGLPGPGDQSTPLVAVLGVTFGYPGAAGPAVAGVTLTAAGGEVVGIVGANGSGKTTLGRLVNGLLRPALGRVTVDGMDTAAHPVRTLAAHVGSVFQDSAHQLFARTVADELALGPRAIGMSEARIGERVREIAEALELGDVLGRHPLRLGRAERKLVALGAVLAMGPRVLVLDEPTTGTDARLAGIVEAQVRAAAKAGCAVLIASHDMAFLGRVAGRLVVMEAGRVVADAPARSVFADAPLLAVAGLEAPAVTRVALALGGRGPDPWPPVSLDEALAGLRLAGIRDEAATAERADTTRAGLVP
jgi:energy-coupling factor transport system ATP-binding protein